MAWEFFSHWIHCGQKAVAGAKNKHGPSCFWRNYWPLHIVIIFAVAVLDWDDSDTSRIETEKKFAIIGRVGPIIRSSDLCRPDGLVVWFLVRVYPISRRSRVQFPVRPYAFGSFLFSGFWKSLRVIRPQDLIFQKFIIFEKKKVSRVWSRD